MKPIPVDTARYLANKGLTRRVLVLLLDDQTYSITTYGRRQSEKDSVKRLGALVSEQLEDGRLAIFPPPAEGSSTRSLKRQVQTLTELLTQALAGHDGESCPFGFPEQCLRCRLAREHRAMKGASLETPTPSRARRRKPAGPSTEEGFEESAAARNLGSGLGQQSLFHQQTGLKRGAA